MEENDEEDEEKEEEGLEVEGKVKEGTKRVTNSGAVVSVSKITEDTALHVLLRDRGEKEGTEEL